MANYKRVVIIRQGKDISGEFISVLLAFDKEVSLSPDRFTYQGQVPVVEIASMEQIDGYINQSAYFPFVVKTEFFYKKMQDYRIEVRKRQFEVGITGGEQTSGWLDFIQKVVKVVGNILGALL